MKKLFILTFCAAILVLSTSVRADFPCEEAWSIDLDTTITILGPSWQDDDGQTFYLIGMVDRVQIVNEDGVVWESPELDGEVTALNSIDFGIGDGREIITATTIVAGSEIEIRLHRFNGEDYEQLTDYLILKDRFAKRINKIDYFPENLPDSSETIYLGTQYEWESSHRLEGVRSGDVLEFSCFEDSTINHVRRIGMVISTCLINIDENDTQCIVYAVDSEAFDEADISENCGFNVLNSDLQSISSELLYSANNWPGSPLPAKMIDCLVMKRDQDEVEDAYIIFEDSAGVQIQRFPQPDFERGERVALPGHISYNYSKCHHFHQASNDVVEDFVIYCFNNGSVWAIDIDSFRIAAVYENVFPYHRGSAIGNFDDDEDLEIVVLTQRTFTMYDFGTLSAPSGSEPLWIPESYAISAAYPNPFNSSTRLEYEIPQAGNVALSVFDITGREILKLIDGWRDVGKYNIVLDGDNLTSGMYLISLDTGGRKVIRRVQLLK